MQQWKQCCKGLFVQPLVSFLQQDMYTTIFIYTESFEGFPFQEANRWLDPSVHQSASAAVMHFYVTWVCWKQICCLWSLRVAKEYAAVTSVQKPGSTMWAEWAAEIARGFVGFWVDRVETSEWILLLVWYSSRFGIVFRWFDHPSWKAHSLQWLKQYTSGVGSNMSHKNTARSERDNSAWYSILTSREVWSLRGTGALPLTSGTFSFVGPTMLSILLKHRQGEVSCIKSWHKVHCMQHSSGGRQTFPQRQGGRKYAGNTLRTSHCSMSQNDVFRSWKAFC